MNKKVKLTDEYIKLDSLLKYMGKTQTGGQAKILILEGKVFVNGEKCTMRGKKLYPGDIVTIEDDDCRIEVE